jgi:transposase-like protein
MGSAVVRCENLHICRVEFLDQRVPHTEKRPERCRHCGSTAITRKGIRRKKIEIVQLWRCSSCKRVFTPTPAAMRGKTFPLRVVLDAITLFDLGYSLEQTADKIRARHGHRVGRSTIAVWVAEHHSLTTHARLRPEGRRLFPPTQTIRSVKLAAPPEEGVTTIR